MKILQTNLFNYPSQSYPVVQYRRMQNNQDTFVKSNPSVSFTGETEEINPYQQIMQNPTLTQKFMEMMSNVAAMLITKSGGNYSPDDGAVSDNIVKIVVERQNDDDIESKKEIKALKEDMRRMKEENRMLKMLLERKDRQSIIPSPPEGGNEVIEKTEENPEEKPADVVEILPERETEDAGYKFEFPKKKAGVLSNSQKELKSVIANIKVNKDSGEKLSEICRELLQKGSHEIDGQIVDNKELTDELSKKLIECSNEEVPQVVDEFYKKCGLNYSSQAQEKNDEIINHEVSISNGESAGEISSEPESPKNGIYETEKPVLKGVTVKGKINLDEIKDTRRKKSSNAESNAEIPKQTESAGVKPKRPRIVNSRAEKVTATEGNSGPQADFHETTQMQIINPKSKSSLFFIPGTVDKDVKNNLKSLLLKFESQIKNDEKNPRWQCSRPLGVRLTDKDIIQEIKDQLKNDPNGAYENITKYNAADVAEAINSDSRFHEMFGIHGAMRLIERYADFNSDEPLNDQCKNILDNLTNVLQKSFKEGLEVRRYEDTNGRIGLRIIIPEKAYDDSARRIFGSYPLGFGICEKQPKLPYYDKELKEPLFYTLFKKGI